MHLLYNILILLALPLLILYHTYRSVSRGRPASLLPRFGFIAAEDLKPLKGRNPIWVHAVSVGETIAVKPLLSQLKAKYPDRPIVLSNMTETGRSIAAGISSVDLAIYFPFDYPFSVSRLLKSVNPCLVIIVETELWPNFLRSSRKLGIPAMIVNGRISDRSHERYRKLRGYFGSVLSSLSACCMQSSADAERVIDIGAPSSIVEVTRNLKFDISSPELSEDELGAIRRRYAISDSSFVFTAGSTHHGEEEAVLKAFGSLCREGGDSILVLVPRHPERAADVAALVQRAGLTCCLRSSLGENPTSLEAGQVLIVDTVGELMSIYSISDLVFVGGSLVPVGGHNLLEPASMGVATLFGPNMSNFREISEMSIDYGCASMVDDDSGLALSVTGLYRDGKRRQEMGRAGKRLIAEQGGATALNMAVIYRLLGGGDHGSR